MSLRVCFCWKSYIHTHHHKTSLFQTSLFPTTPGYFSHLEARSGTKGIKKVCVWCAPKFPCLDSSKHPDKCKRCFADKRRCCFHQVSQQGRQNVVSTAPRQYLGKYEWNERKKNRALSANPARPANSNKRHKVAQKLSEKSSKLSSKKPDPVPQETDDSDTLSSDDLEYSVADLGHGESTVASTSRSGRRCVPTAFYHQVKWKESDDDNRSDKKADISKRSKKRKNDAMTSEGK